MRLCLPHQGSSQFCPHLCSASLGSRAFSLWKDKRDPKAKMLFLQSFLRKGMSLGYVGRNCNLKDLKEIRARRRCSCTAATPLPLPRRALPVPRRARPVPKRTRHRSWAAPPLRIWTASGRTSRLSMTLHPTPYTPYPTPYYTLHPTPYTLHHPCGFGPPRNVPRGQV